MVLMKSMRNGKARDLSSQIERYLATDTRESSMTQPLPGLVLLRSPQITELDATLYEPVVCLIVQGSKEVWLGDQKVAVGPGESLVVSHEVPVISRITAATPQEPYLAMIVVLDVSLLRSLYDEVGDAAPATAPANSLAACPADPTLFDCLSRYLGLADDPVEAKVMTPLLRKELHFRLLMAPNGSMLRNLLLHDSHASAVTRAITKIRRDFRSSLKIPELAREIGMSPSSFHKHFKDITSTTPLQFQKELRLLEARKLLSTGGLSVSDVAYEVGYESPNQFSREYSRKFGASPRDALPASP